MLRSKVRPHPSFIGRWRIAEMGEWDRDYLGIEVPAFIQFDRDGTGQFQFGTVQGTIDHRPSKRDGQPAIEWTWEGNDECDPVMGRGWAVLESERSLVGHLFIHQGDDSSFRAERLPRTTLTVRSSQGRPRQASTARKRRKER